MPKTKKTAPIVKVCRCGLAYSLKAWRGLARVGVQSDGAGGQLELRNCHCGSSLAITRHGVGHAEEARHGAREGDEERTR